MNKMLGNNKGFTLVEMAIVLVIIGLLLGGVLKGQELIDNSKAKRLAGDMNSISVAYNGYLDRYGRIPGDDGPIGTLTARGANWTAVTAAGNANGILVNLPAATFTGAGEGNAFWQAVKAAGFIAGNPADTGIPGLPINAYQGLTGIANNTAVVPLTGLVPGVSVCVSQIPGKIAAQLDAQLDDRIPGSGSVRATLGTAGVNTAPGTAPVPPAGYVESSVYTVCRAI